MLDKKSVGAELILYRTYQGLVKRIETLDGLIKFYSADNKTRLTTEDALTMSYAGLEEFRQYLEKEINAHDPTLLNQN